jgi:hypothetical protein
MANPQTPPASPPKPKGFAKVNPMRAVKAAQNAKNNIKVNRAPTTNGVKANAAFTALGAGLDYHDARKHGLNKKQAGATAAADAPVGFATWHAFGHMKMNSQNAAHAHGMEVLKEHHPDIAKNMAPGASLGRKTEAGVAYRDAVRGPLARGFAKRAGVLAAGTVASTKIVGGLEHHFQQKNVRARNKHPQAGGR